MSRQSLDAAYGRRGGRIAPWSERPAETLDCTVCGKPVLSGSTANVHEVCRPSLEQPATLFDEPDAADIPVVQFDPEFIDRPSSVSIGGES
jgi:hypothetical protein